MPSKETTVAATLTHRLQHRVRLAVSDIPRAPGPKAHQPLRLELVLITQIARSGGTLLAQLLDAHPECLTHPFELEIGRRRRQWPELSAEELVEPEAAFDVLYERSIDRFIMEGLSPHLPGSRNETRHPFRFSRSTCRRVFVGAWRSQRPTSQREVLDLYFSAFWAAWSEAPDRHTARWLAAFRPGAVADPAFTTGFFGDYPSGRLVSIIREPVSWFASAQRHKSNYAEASRAGALWVESVVATLQLKRERPEQVYVDSFERLVGDTAAFTRDLADWLGITWNASMLEPTMAGRPMRADSSFADGTFGIRTASIDRRDAVSDLDRREIERRCRSLHDEASTIFGR
jgi:hypothetical protein